MVLAVEKGKMDRRVTALMGWKGGLWGQGAGVILRKGIGEEVHGGSTSSERHPYIENKLSKISMFPRPYNGRAWPILCEWLD